MGNLTKKDKILIIMVSIISMPYVFIKQILTWLGVISATNYEYDPSKDPNYVEPAKPDKE